ncbi:hypothetical protein ACHQM5_020189 [Ranunculus cassubicifolius]
MAEDNKEELPSLPLPILGIENAVSSSSSKTHWPELMGLSAEEAQSKIKLDMVGAEVQVVPPDHFVTMDFNTQRVRLYLDASGKVARTPQVG